MHRLLPLILALLLHPHLTLAQQSGPVDITAAATVAASMGEDEHGQPVLPDRWSDQVLRDGSVAAASAVIGHANLNARFMTTFAWQAFESRWEWSQPRAIAALELLVADPPQVQQPPLCVKVLAKTPEGAYMARLLHTEYAQFAPVPDWRDRADPTLKAQRLRISLHAPFVTTGLQIMVGTNRGWVELGEVRILALPEIPPPPAKPTALPSQPQPRLWFANPWGDTAGGTRLPTTAELKAPWALRICRNDTEQAMIGLLNPGQAPLPLTVAAQGAPAGMKAELLACGAIEARGTPEEWWAEGKTHSALVNLLSAEQVRSFRGYFPRRFVGQEAWSDFPHLVLPPGQPVWVWLRLSTVGPKPPQPGSYKLTFTAGKLRREVAVRVLKVTLPPGPVIGAQTYGHVNDADSLAHHTTMDTGYRHFTRANLVVPMGLWGKDLVKLKQEDPAGFQQRAKEGLERLYADCASRGWRKDQVLVEVYDETNDSTIDQWLAMAETIRAVDPTAIITANPPLEWAGHPCTLEKTVQPMAPYVDFWAPHLGLIDDHPDNLAVMRATGKPVWFYVNVALGTARSESAISGFYRTAGWSALKLKLDGIGFWSAASYYGDMWDDFDRDGYTDWPDAAVAFATEDRDAIATRQWESWRETIEDVAIYKLLERAVRDRCLRPADVPAARRWLAEAPDKVLKHSQKQEGFVVARARDQALDLLERCWDDRRGLEKGVVIPGPEAKARELPAR